jgi:homoserine kinase
MAGATFRAAPVRVRVPASSANLGPGFDACGLALALYDDVVVQVTERGVDCQVAGEGADKVQTGERNLVVKALRAAFTALGGQPRGIAVRSANRMPHGRGLGSSAGAIVAGVLAARGLVVGGNERLDDLAVLGLAAKIEGHPDNVAACLLGGYTIAWTDADGVRALSQPVAASLVPVVFVPTSAVATAKARRLLPEQIPFADASLSAGRAALLTAAITGRLDLLLAATEDRLHQQYRASAMPRSAALVERLRRQGVAAVISGAGPTVLALTDTASADGVVALAPKGWAVQRLEVDREGARLVPL